jgi:hypothetical protein
MNQYEWMIRRGIGDEPEIYQRETKETPPDHISAVNTFMLTAISENIDRNDLLKTVNSIGAFCEVLKKASGNNAKVMYTLVHRLCGWSFRQLGDKTGESYEIHRRRMLVVKENDPALFDLLSGDDSGFLNIFVPPAYHKKGNVDNDDYGEQL